MEQAGEHSTCAGKYTTNGDGKEALEKRARHCRKRNGGSREPMKTRYPGCWRNRLPGHFVFKYKKAAQNPGLPGSTDYPARLFQFVATSAAKFIGRGNGCSALRAFHSLLSAAGRAKIRTRCNRRAAGDAGARPGSSLLMVLHLLDKAGGAKGQNPVSYTHLWDAAAVLLLHSNSATNAQILGDVIDKWQADGYTLKSLDDLPAPAAASQASPSPSSLTAQPAASGT